MMKKIALVLFILKFTNSFGQIINDESYKDVSFMKFKNELIVFIKKALKLKSFLADRVFESNNICGYPGCTKDELIKYYFKESPEESWEEILKIVRFWI